MIAAILSLALLSARPADHLHFALYGDDRDGHEVHRKLVALIAAEHPDFVLNTGDLVHRGNDPALWKIFDDITGDLRKQTEYFAARGNHDLGDPDFVKRFTSSTMSGEHLYYSFNRGRCHFVALAVDEETPYGPSSEQYHWLVDDLKANQGKFKHTFVFFHVPPYSIGRHGSNLDVRKELCPVFEKYHVRAVLNGHDHNYYRTKRNGIAYIVSGGGGAPLYETDPKKGAIEGDKYESVNHFLIFDVDGDAVHGKAIRADGSVIEEFDLGK
jgi:predicted phosphodiesterase